MASRANLYYRLLINWTAAGVQAGLTGGGRASAFSFKRLQQWDRKLLHAPVQFGGGGCVCRGGE